jgi:hypothetical protein
MRCRNFQEALTNPLHRKVISYNTFGDDRRDDDVTCGGGSYDDDDDDARVGDVSDHHHAECGLSLTTLMTLITPPQRLRGGARHARRRLHTRQFTTDQLPWV